MKNSEEKESYSLLKLSPQDVAKTMFYDLKNFDLSKKWRPEANILLGSTYALGVLFLFMSSLAYSSQNAVTFGLTVLLCGFVITVLKWLDGHTVKKDDGNPKRPELSIRQPLGHEEYRLAWSGGNAKAWKKLWSKALPLPFNHDDMNEFFSSHEEAHQWVDGFIAGWEDCLEAEQQAVREERKQRELEKRQKLEAAEKQKKFVETKRR